MSKERAPVCHEEHGKTCCALHWRGGSTHMTSGLLSDTGTSSDMGWDMVSSAWPVMASRERDQEERLNTLWFSI